MARRAVKLNKARDRDIHKVLQIIQGERPGTVARLAKISPGTVAKWRIPYNKGGTLRPQHYTMSQVLRAYGHEWKIVPKQGWYERG